MAYEAEGVEEWRPAPGRDGVEVSDRGRVRSRRAANGKPLPPGEWRVCKLSRQSKGYLTAWVGGRAELVHRLVLEAFVGPCPGGMEARHVDDNDRSNNALANLAWGTPAENARDRYRHRAIRTRLSVDAAAAVKRRLLDGEPADAVAAAYGVTRERVGRVRSGREWGWVSPAGH